MTIAETIPGQESAGLAWESSEGFAPGKPIHAYVQVVNKELPLEKTVPIVFHGLDELQRRKLALDVTVAEIWVRGNMESVPACLAVDVSNRQLGDKITVADLELNNLEILDSKNESLAVVTMIKYFGLVS